MSPQKSVLILILSAFSILTAPFLALLVFTMINFLSMGGIEVGSFIMLSLISLLFGLLSMALLVGGVYGIYKVIEEN